MHVTKRSIAAAIAIATTISTVTLNPSKAAAFTSQNITVDFDENVGVGSNPLTGGPKLDNLWAGYGLKMDSSVKELWLYNSSCKRQGSNGISENGFTNSCTGGDEDLATGKGKYLKNNQWYTYDSEAQGKVLIIQENNNSPDDLAGGGKITFDFTDELGVDFHDIGLLDFDDPGQPKFKFTFLNNTFQELSFGQDADENDPRVTLLSKTWDGDALKKDNSLRKYDFNFENVKKLEITLPGSGAVTHLNYTRKHRVPEPTSALGLLFGAFGMVSVIKRKAS
jgi:hypothetical protein